LNKTIAIVTTNVPPTICGVGDYSVNLYQQLKKHYKDVQLVVKKRENPDNVLSEFNIYEITKKWNFISWVKLWRHVKKDKPTVLLQYVAYQYNKYGMPFSIILFYVLCKLSRISVITTYHEVAIRYNDPKFTVKGNLTAFSQKIIARSIAKLSHAIVASNSWYFGMIAKYNRNAQTIGIGSPIKLINDKVNIKDNNIFNILTFGNRVTIELIEALKEIMLENKNVQATIIGKFNKAHQDLVRGLNFSFTGLLELDEMATYFSAADLYIQLEPVNDKGMGGLSLKSSILPAAFQYQLPVLSTKGDMTDVDLFQNKVNIFFCNNNIMDIKASVCMIIESKTLRNTVAQKSHAFYQENLTQEVIANKYRTLID
jgi:glycosyltransferase involved in cell wall biosynthesis